MAILAAFSVKFAPSKWVGIVPTRPIVPAIDMYTSDELIVYRLMDLMDFGEKKLDVACLDGAILKVNNSDVRQTRVSIGKRGTFRKTLSTLNHRHIPQPHYIPGRRYRPDARRLLPLRVPTGDAAGEQFVEQGVAQALRGSDDGLGVLDGRVYGVQHGGDGPLLGQGRRIHLGKAR